MQKTKPTARALGQAGLEVTPLGMGCMGIASESYGPTDEAESIATLHRAFDLGVRFLDTSDVYGPYTSERIIGRALKGRRDDIVVGTKFGIVPSDGTAPIAGGHEMGIRGTPEYVKAACDASLKRLGIDCIDIYYQHRLDPNVPIEETVGALAELVEAGKIRFIGLSEVNTTVMERAHRIHPITAVQMEYSLWSRGIEQDILPTARGLGIGVVAYSPLGRGFLSGAIRSVDDLASDDYRRVNPRFTGANLQQNLALVDEMVEIAADLECTPSQLALAWVLAQGDDIVTIPGAQKTSEIEENIGALDLALPHEILARLQQLFAPDAIAGERYPEAHMPYKG